MSKQHHEEYLVGKNFKAGLGKQYLKLYISHGVLFNPSSENCKSGNEKFSDGVRLFPKSHCHSKSIMNKTPMSLLFC